MTATTENGQTVFDVYVRTVRQTGELIHTVRDEEFGLPTPCAAWTVRDIVNHLVTVAWYLVQLSEGERFGWGEVDQSIDRLGDDPGATYDALTNKVIEWKREQLTPSSLNDVEKAGGSIVDVLAHYWDLSKALGRSTQLEADAVEIAWEVALAHVSDKDRSDDPHARFGPAVGVPDDAPLQDRLLGHLGRRP